jgi:predicted nucleic acid-binding Zn ribbon protein
MAHGHASIQSVLGGLLKDRHLIPSMRRVMVMSLWEQVVGPLVARKSWPEKFDNDTLVVGVSSHSWAAQLHLLKPQILSRYRQLLGRAALKDVAFRVGRRKRMTDEESRTVELHPAPTERLSINPVPQDVLSGVSNPEVKNLLGPVFARMRAEREWKRERGWVRCSGCERIFHGPTCPQCGRSATSGDPS